MMVRTNPTRLIAFGIAAVVIAIGTIAVLWFRATPFAPSVTPFQGPLPTATPIPTLEVVAGSNTEKKPLSPEPTLVFELLPMTEDEVLNQRARGSKPPQPILSVDRLNDGTLNVTYGLPEPNMLGIPRAYLATHPKSKERFLVLAPPPAKARVAEQFKLFSSPWQEAQLLENGELNPATAAAVPTEQIQPFGPCVRIRLPETRVIWEGVKPTESAQFNSLELGKVTDVLSDIHKPENAELRNALRDVILAQPNHAFLWDQHFSKENQIREDLQVLKSKFGFVPQFTDVKGLATAKNKRVDALVRTIRFDASQARWFFMPFSNAVSPWLRIEFTVPAGAKKFELLARIGNDLEIGQEIYSIQSEVVQKTAADWKGLPPGAWPGETWMVPASPASLNPFTFIAILQSLEATSGDAAELSPTQAASREATELLMGRMNAGHIVKMQNTLKAIESAHGGPSRSVQHYHNTYLYCEYLVALVHLKRLHERLPPTNDFRLKQPVEDKLDKLIFEAAGVIGRQIESDGKFRRYMNGGPDYDRSVGQVALYALQYTHFLYNSPQPPNELAGVTESLRKLSRWYSDREGVRYADGAGYSAHIHPGYFQAQIAKIQIGDTRSVNEADIAKLAQVFTDGNYLSGRETAMDAYRWMYWSRVFELLTNLRKQGLASFPPDEVTDASLAKFEKVLKLNLAPPMVLPQKTWKPDPTAALPANPPVPYPDAVSREIMLMIAMESMRSVLSNRSSPPTPPLENPQSPAAAP